jgi:hypothetical protein
MISWPPLTPWFPLERWSLCVSFYQKTMMSYAHSPEPQNQ